MFKLTRNYTAPLLTIIILLVSVGALAYVKQNNPELLLENPTIQRIIPLYRSVRKLPDIVFMPWAAFATSRLETYELTISPKNVDLMNKALPEQPFNSHMDENAKVWVSGYFRTSDYEGNVKVRYRGNQAVHWNAYQKSYSIKFPNNNLFKGMRELTLVIPSKRRYIGMSLNDYRAKKLGLIAPDESLVRLELNGADTGVMLAFEAWSQEWIEKMPISSLSTIYGVEEFGGSYQDRWKSWNSEEPVDFEPLLVLEQIVEHASDEEFKRLMPQIIDLEDWLAWDIMSVLASGYHADPDTSFGANNLVLIFDRTEGRFKPVPYNTVIFTESFREQINNTGMQGAPTRIQKRILSIPEFRAKRDKLFADYVKNEKDDDLRYLEEWKEKYLREFLLDNAKNDNHFMFLEKVAENIKAAESHFADPYGIIDMEYDVTFDDSKPINYPESFKYLPQAIVSTEEAAKQHSALRVRDGEIFIPRGAFTFEKTIIIPAGTKLTIAPGANLLFAEGASFVSYSPVIAEGTEVLPITLAPVGRNPWGVFAVLNTGTATSSFKHMTLRAGSEATINGAYISGTLALHNANSVIDQVKVSDAEGDDGINVKGSHVVFTNNRLENNSSDGVDFDYIAADSVITGNVFKDNQGDALDISWSYITIENNEIDNCGDKGISVGEASQPLIINNQISGCAIGIAIKDSSRVIIDGGTIRDSATALSAYQKKPFFGGGFATSTNLTIENVQSKTFTDNLSSIVEL